MGKGGGNKGGGAKGSSKSGGGGSKDSKGAKGGAAAEGRRSLSIMERSTVIFCRRIMKLLYAGYYMRCLIQIGNAYYKEIAKLIKQYISEAIE